MSSKSEAALRLFKLEKAKAELAALTLAGLSDNSVVRALHWSAFLQSCKSAVAALIRFGMQSASTTPVAHKIRNWESGDKVFKYLLHARNAEVHAQEHDDAIANPVRSSKLEIGHGGIWLTEGSSVSISGMEVDGVRLDGDFSVSATKIHGNIKTEAPMAFTPKQIVLRSIKDQQGNVYEFPFDLVPNGELPEQFAVRHALERLTAWELELRAQQQTNAE